MPQMRLGFPRPTYMVKWLLILNIGIYILEAIYARASGNQSGFARWFAVLPVDFLHSIQVWRLITYQFLHWEPWHLFVNMLGLYFLGPTLERHWGSKRFLKFYLSCGAIGGLFYTLLANIGFLGVGPMEGASGAILGLLAACAILFPQFVVFILFFPVPIRVAAIGLTVLYIISIISRADNAGGDAAHLAGLAAGAVYVFSGPWRQQWTSRFRQKSSKKQYQKQQMLKLEVDRILKKVHEKGIHSLSMREKRILKQATESERRSP